MKKNSQSVPSMYVLVEWLDKETKEYSVEPEKNVNLGRNEKSVTLEKPYDILWKNRPYSGKVLKIGNLIIDYLKSIN